MVIFQLFSKLLFMIIFLPSVSDDYKELSSRFFIYLSIIDRTHELKPEYLAENGEHFQVNHMELLFDLVESAQQ